MKKCWCWGTTKYRIQGSVGRKTYSNFSQLVSSFDSRSARCKECGCYHLRSPLWISALQWCLSPRVFGAMIWWLSSNSTSAFTFYLQLFPNIVSGCVWWETWYFLINIARETDGWDSGIVFYLSHKANIDRVEEMVRNWQRRVVLMVIPFFWRCG